ncbi:purine nucleoside phosphorylase [Lasallia pustulata]|uniref:Purine nucleoside phosphorylase n=1 Tax=Lasallia pustulata TaxID=136370 RepID=A0A1W5CY33_9LECA|nr:purine nucleoside phosphorylase [Lasallia pustulata]
MLATPLFAKATEALHYIQQRLPSALEHPVAGVICGSGLGGLARTVQREPQVEINYADIPYFPNSTVPGHAGKLLFGLLGRFGIRVVLMVGRAHYYEGHSIDSITFPIRVLKLLGVESIIVTNAAGGLNPAYAHLNLSGLAGTHPLRGSNADEFGVRFPPLSDAYDLDLRRRAHRAWKSADRGEGGRTLHEGIYAFVGGPSYETRAECRMLRALGADLVGMSTVPEIVVARHCGIRVLALSLVTNEAVLEEGPRGCDAGLEGFDREGLTGIIEQGKASHEEVLEAGRQAAADMQELVRSIVESLSD